MVDFSGVLDLLVVRWQIMVLTCNCRGLTNGLMDVKIVFADVDSLVIDVDEDFLMMHYIQFVLGSEHADWMVEILEFDGVMQMWMICRLVCLSLLRWKPLVKMKMVLTFLWESKCGTHFSTYLGSLMQEHLGFAQ